METVQLESDDKYVVGRIIIVLIIQTKVHRVNLPFPFHRDIVHRDVKLDNVLIFRSDFTKVKLCDFGESYQTGTVVERRNEWLPYSPPEVLQVKPEDTYV